MARREWMLVLVGTTLTIGALWLVTYQGGALGIARADDWSYLLTQFEFARSGSIQLNNWAVTMLVGQIILAAPFVSLFGTNITMLQGLVAVFAWGALVMSYVVSRRVLPPRWAWMVPTAVALSPVFGPSAVSFMTDVPALFFLLVSLWLGIRSVRLEKPAQWVGLGLSAVAAVIAFTFRDYAIVAFLAVAAVAASLARTKRQGIVIVGLVAVTAFLAICLYSWRHSLDNDLVLEGWTLGRSLQLVARAFLTLALLLLPALSAIAWTRLASESSSRLSPKAFLPWLVAVGISGVTLLVAGFELLGNVIHPYGGTWLIAGSGIRLWPLSVNRALIALSALALAVLLVFCIQTIWKVRPLIRSAVLLRSTLGAHAALAIIVAFVAGLLAAHVGATLILGTWFIDRYFILLLPMGLAALLAVGLRFQWLVRGRASVIPLLAVTIYGIWGLHVTDFDARFDGSRWDLGRMLVESGFRANEIDAGMQWVSYHAGTTGLGAQEVPTRAGRQWWTERYPGQRVCVTVIAVEGSSEYSGETSFAELRVTPLLGQQYRLIAVPGPDVCE